MTDTLIVILGVFIATAFSAVIITLQRKKLPVGYWPLIGAMGLFITMAEIFSILGFESYHRLLMLITLFIFSMIAFMKFWETMSLDY